MAIDHDRRRHDIAELAIDLIAREGLGAATIRRIAAEARFSTAAITHYFTGKHELLVWTFEVLARTGVDRFEASLDPADPMPALMTMVPWNAANQRRWKAYLAFWDEAARDGEIAALIERETRYGLDCIERLVRTAAPEGSNIASASRLLNAIVQGLSMQAIVSPQAWPRDAFEAALAEALAMAVSAAT
jgi:AcrR family transcriptional regulator